METLELRLRNAPHFRCEKGNSSVPVCQKCETCVLTWKIFSTKQWFRRIGELPQRRFLVSILGQLDSLYLLHYFQNILQATQGKDFTYSRSRINLSKKEGKIGRSSLNQMLDKTVEQKMREILYWFGNSTHWTKANYTLLLFQMCDPKLLLTAANVIRVLILREQSNVAGLSQSASDVFVFPGKDHHQSETSQVCRAAGTKNTSFPLSRSPGKEGLLENMGGGPSDTGQWKSSLQCISEMNRLFSRKAGRSKAESAPSDLLVDLDVVRDLSSGARKYQDFIRHLPIHLSKYILSMLDKNSLNRCAFVSQHWAALAQQVKKDLSMHTFIQNQIAFLQGSYTGGIEPNYANKLLIPVPKMTDDGKRMRAKNQKWKLRMKNDYNLWTAYQNQETQQVQMEERNVFCGTYNIRILSDTWDRNRIIHYSGGHLVAVSSNRRIQLLDVLQVKEVPIVFQGHAGSVRALFLCEKKNFLLSGSYDLSIRYWDLKSGACIRIFNGHQGTVTCMDLYMNKLVSGARDCQVKEWDVETGKCLKTLKHKDPIWAARINDSYIVSSCERGIIKVWHTVTAQLVKGGASCGSSLPPGHQRLCRRQDPYLQFPKRELSEGDESQWQRMVINTESNILMFQFENVKWQYSLDKAKQKKKEKEEDREENGLVEVLSRSSTQVSSLKDSLSSQQTVTQESLLSKPGRSRVFRRTTRLLTDDEKIQKERRPVDMIKRSKKKSWQIPMSPDQFLLTVNALQQAHNSGAFAYPRRPQTQVIDAQGPSIPHPRKVLSFKGKSIQHAVDRLRRSEPPIDVKQTNIPLEIQNLQPNLKNSLHSPRVQSTIPQPVIIHPRLTGSCKGEDQVTSSIDGTVRAFSPLTSTQVIKPNRMLAPPAGMTTKSVKRERPHFCTTLDPFRANTQFMLLTVREEKEYREAKRKEHQARKPTEVLDPEKASKSAWIRKIQGLPIDNFLKQGKIAAPELGQNMFI
ncbi:F-box and WD repeat domain containing protein 10B isoform X3 [Panthera pardus]|uniref:F-box and WD repeat domain containing protein 10B isoform X3 n=1 Tax=Panthera pardus TaxID=9691 RepID=A0A9W2URN7_PANPR|nr:F-box and WD repeat domain containing protein 10B isoform X3 [Panthera pardus]